MRASSIRKQVYDLSLSDLRHSPIWEFALNEESETGQDEGTVRPLACTSALDESSGMFIVSASFTLADGTLMWGYVTPSRLTSALGTVQPHIVTPQGQVQFWYGIQEPTSDNISASYGRLGKSSSTQVFPIRFKSEVKLVGGPLLGNIPGFMMRTDLGNNAIRALT